MDELKILEPISGDCKDISQIQVGTVGTRTSLGLAAASGVEQPDEAGWPLLMASATSLSGGSRGQDFAQMGQRGAGSVFLPWQLQSGSGGGEQRGKAGNWCKSFELRKTTWAANRIILMCRQLPPGTALPRAELWIPSPPPPPLWLELGQGCLCHWVRVTCGCRACEQLQEGGHGGWGC